MAKIYDTFLFSGELDLLECRLRELQDRSDVCHVIVEGAHTFQGDPKPLYYAGNKERFAPWRDRIRYVVAEPSTAEPGKEPGDPWAREHSSRQAARHGITDAAPGDIILHGDVDELPSSAALDQLLALEGAWPVTPFKLPLRMAFFAVDWLAPWTWNAPSVMRAGQCADFTVLRETGWPTLPMDGPAGWHLTWLGGNDAIIRKVHMFSHAEVIPLVEDAVARGKFYERGMWTGGTPDGVFHDWMYLTPAEVDETWPRWVYERKCPASWFRPRTEI